ncbi:MAG: cyclase family protein [Actinomycetota bacterium]
MCLEGTLEAVRDHRLGDASPRLSRRAALAAGAGAVLGAALVRPALATSGRNRAVKDLTHTFGPRFPIYTGLPTPERSAVTTVEKNGFYNQRWDLVEHSGTHMDAPGHFIAGGRVVPEISPEELLVSAVVVDIAKRAGQDPDTGVTPEDLERFERRHGRIPRRAAVFMYSGWEARAGNQDAYRNRDANGVHHFPGFGRDAVEWLLDHRDITCIGVDTLSLDIGRVTTFDVHHKLLGADRYGIENLANLKSIPAKGATVVVGVIPWEEGSGGPCRVLAMLP